MDAAHWLHELENSDYERRMEARQTFIDYDGDVCTMLIPVMMEEQGRRSWEAAIILAQRHESCALPYMVRLLSSQHPTIGQVAAEALAQYGCEYVDHMLEALPKSTALTQLTLVKILGTLGDKCAVEPLVRLLKTTESSTIIHLTIKTLTNLGDSSVLPVIETFQNHEDHHVRKSVLAAQERLSDSIQNGDKQK